MIGMVQGNITATITEKFSMIEETLASDIFLKIIYTTISKFLMAMSRIVWILDLGAIKYISDDWTRFSDLIAYKDFCCTASGEQLKIKGKKNIDLAVKNTVFRLLDAFKDTGFTINFISTARP